MSKALRAVIATAILGLALAPAAGAQTGVTDFVLARDSCGGGSTTPANERLDLSTGASTLACATTTSWLEPTLTVFPAQAGMPITVDGTRHVQIVIAANSYAGTAVGGIGDQTTAVELIGTTLANKRVTMAKDTQTIPAADMLRKPSYTAEFDLPVVGGDYKALRLNLTIGGSALHGFVHYDGSSYVSLPVPTA